MVKERSDAMLTETAELRAHMEQELAGMHAAVQAKEVLLEKEHGRVQVMHLLNIGLPPACGLIRSFDLSGARPPSGAGRRASRV